MAGTDNMETMMRTSALHPMSHDTISIFERAGSRGNSTIRRPVGVKAPRSTCQSTMMRLHVEKVNEKTVDLWMGTKKRDAKPSHPHPAHGREKSP